MYDDEILKAILDSAAEKALQKIKKESSISLEEAIPLLLRGQYNHIVHLDKEITEIKSQLKNMATKDDIRDMATKNDIKNMATKDDIKNMATKDDIRDMATKNDIKNMATKDDIKDMATKEDIKHLKWMIGIGFSFITLIIGIIGIIALLK